MSILCLGEAIVDLVHEAELEDGQSPGPLVPYPGGALANVAVAAARAGAEAALLGGVGDDEWGLWMRRGLEAEGVELRWLAEVEGADTPIATVLFDSEREPRFQVYGEHIGPTMVAARPGLEQAIAGAGALVVGSNTLVGEAELEVTLEAKRLALEAGVPILFDPNLRPNRWREMEPALELCRELAEGCLLVRTNLQEARALTGLTEAAGAAEGLLRLGVELAVVTDGPRPTVMRGAARAEGEPPRVEVVCPLGAGDAFMGGLAAGMAERGWDPARAGEALPGALAAGAEACTRWSAQ